MAFGEVKVDPRRLEGVSYSRFTISDLCQVSFCNYIFLKLCHVALPLSYICAFYTSTTDYLITVHANDKLGQF
jgi:hypothetical protein